MWERRGDDRGNVSEEREGGGDGCRRRGKMGKER